MMCFLKLLKGRLKPELSGNGTGNISTAGGSNVRATRPVTYHIPDETRCRGASPSRSDRMFGPSLTTHYVQRLAAIMVAKRIVEEN
jgi:hypothetical protein